MEVACGCGQESAASRSLYGETGSSEARSGTTWCVKRDEPGAISEQTAL